MKIVRKDILNESVEIKNFIEKNKKLPTYATINNSKFTPAQYTYLLSKLVSNINAPSVAKLSLKEPSNPSGKVINEKVVKDDYLDMAKRVSEYIEKNRQVPNYVSTKNSKIKVRFELYVYCFTKILVYYKNNNTLPNYCIFNSSDIKNTTTTSTNTKKTTTTSISTSKNTTKKSNCTDPYTSSPHFLEQGCNRLGQCTNYFCAPHGIHQCLKKLGITKYNEQTLAKYCATTTSGTSHEGINTCIAKVSKETKKTLKVTWKNFSDLGSTKKERYLALSKLLCKNNVAILLHIGYQGSGNSATGKIFGHYECLDKINNSYSKVRALNSLGNKCGNGFCGHLQERSFDLQSTYLSNVSQKSVCIIEKV